jgi:hypothetical protein
LLKGTTLAPTGRANAVIRNNQRQSEASSVIAALADRLNVTPQDLSEWIRQSEGVPPQVLLARISGYFKLSLKKASKKR